jgi:hypothetical protein
MHQEFFDLQLLLDFVSTSPGSGIRAFCRLGLLKQQAAQLVAALLGNENLGFELLVESDAIRHIQAQHGPAKSRLEAMRGQIPIEEVDFLALKNWLPAIITARAGEIKPGKQPRVQVESTDVMGTTVVVLEWRPGRQQLALVTMYKKRPAA